MTDAITVTAIVLAYAGFIWAIFRAGDRETPTVGRRR